MPFDANAKYQGFQGKKVNMCPGHGSGGRHPSRERLDSPSGHDDPGMFGRMFPKLTPLEVSDAKLQTLADAMIDDSPSDTDLDNPDIPGGFTYLGQFIDHDITLDLTSLSDKKRDPTATENFRTPAVDLDNVYGLGPDGSPHLYARRADDPHTRGPKLLLGRNTNVDLGGITGDFRNDLPRSPEGVALIGDPRNDENLLVAQTHLAFLKFHNAICDHLADQGMDQDDIFPEARRVTTWHYQYIALHDWMERLCGQDATAQLLHDGRKHYRFARRPYMPVEFSAAAYRLGHSMVRQVYSFNRVFSEAGPGPSASFDLLFRFTGLSGDIHGERAADNPAGSNPVPVLPSNWIIDWRRFHELERPSDVPFNLSRRLDPLLVNALHDLPNENGEDAVLAFRNLKRGVLFGLPSGQDVARHLGETPLTSSEVASGKAGDAARETGLHEATPLWFYILKEAEHHHDGRRLGPVGATIVSEVLVGLVHGHIESYLYQAGKDWTPTLPAQTPGSFTMADLLRFVDDINPIGD